MLTDAAYRVRWAFPPESQPVPDATVLVTEGVISDITTQNVPEAEDLGSVAIIPGLVNAHVHLEFSSLDDPIAPPLPFTDWIHKVIQSRQQESSPEVALIAGIEETLETRTTAVGEIATGPLSLRMLQTSSLQGVVFHELIGISEQLAREKIGEIGELLTADTTQRNELTVGLSPHAPYSVHPKLLYEIVRQSRAQKCPLAMHLAENPAERELIGHCSGEFRDFLESMDLWPGDVWKELRSIDAYLRVLADADSALVIHGNDLHPDEIAYLSSQPQMSVVYCPRTHAYFEHPRHPLPQLLDRGINVALGTDGRSSNPDLNLWNEVLTVRRNFPELSPHTVLALGTKNGGQALGLGTDGLTIGESPRWSVIPVNDESSETDPWRLLFA